MKFEGRRVVSNLLAYKIKKIVAEHGYLKKSDLTAHELSALNKGALLGQKMQGVNKNEPKR